MTIKLKLRYVLVLALLIIPLLVSGCTTSRAGGDTTATATPTATPIATPTATPTPTPVPGSGTPGSNGVPGSAVVTPTPTTQATPTPVAGAAPFNNPYAKPGWPTYGVNATLVILNPPTTPTVTPTPSVSPTPTPTGRIFGHIYEMSYEPSATPSPMGAGYGAFATTDLSYFLETYDMSAIHIDFVDTNGYYEISDLSYGVYTVDWFYEDLTWYGDNPRTITLSATHSEEEVNLYVPAY